MKIRVQNVEHSIEIQRIFSEKGYEWKGGTDTINHTDEKFLWLTILKGETDKKMFEFSNDEQFFEVNSDIEIFTITKEQRDFLRSFEARDFRKSLKNEINIIKLLSKGYYDIKQKKLLNVNRNKIIKETRYTQ